MGMMNEEREKHIRIANMLIGAINDLIRPILMYQVEKDVTREALENYIKMLEQQPCENCISRKEAINVVHKYFVDYLKLNDDICLDGIRSLPSVTPSRPRGKWIREKRDFLLVYRCSNCKKIIYSRETISDAKYEDLSRVDSYRYCLRCGANMMESEE